MEQFVDFRFASPEGDHVMLLNVFRAFQSTTQKKAWCHENFLHHRNLEYGSEVRQQLAALAERANLERVSCGTNTEQLRKAFLEGLYENLAELQRDQTYVTVSKCFHAMLFLYYIFLIAFLLHVSSDCFIRSAILISRVNIRNILYIKSEFI